MRQRRAEHHLECSDMLSHSKKYQPERPLYDEQNINALDGGGFRIGANWLLLPWLLRA